MNKNNAPILEFDPTPIAIIEPSNILPKLDIPEHCVLCFFNDVIKALHAAGELILRPDIHLSSEIGINPVYQLKGSELLVVHPGVGAPLAVGFLEELIAYGCSRFIACGGAGVLVQDVAVGEVFVPDEAVRDEGASYHYLPASRTVAAHSAALQAIDQVLNQHNIPHRVGKTWTTDGLYRETAQKMANRLAEGCLTVEMESAAFFAVAQFRQIIFGQLLYGGDDLSGDQWDSRDWHKAKGAREKLFRLAVAACKLL